MESPPDISAIITELNQGSEKAFETIYKMYGSKVFAFALSLMKERAEAEEVKQEVFLNLWNKRFDLSPKGSLESYLFTSTKNSVLNILRKAEYHQGFIDHQMHHGEIAENPAQELQYKELDAIYHRAIEKLSPRKRQLYTLNRIESTTCREIAEKLGISIKTVQHQVEAASMEVKQHIHRVWVAGMLILTFFVK